jgi:hypothetical protein
MLTKVVSISFEYFQQNEIIIYLRKLKCDNAGSPDSFNGHGVLTSMTDQCHGICSYS